TDAAATGMTALLNTLAAREATLADRAEAATTAGAAHTQESTAFGAINSLTVGTADTNVNFVGTEFGVLTDGAVTTKYADLVDGKWVLTAAGEAAGAAPIARLDDLYATHKALVAATDAAGVAKDAVKAAVEEIVLLETGAFAVDSLGSAINALSGMSVLTAADIEVFKTEADFNGKAGVKAVYTIDLTGAATTASASDKLLIGTAELFVGDAGAAKTDAEIVTALNGTTIDIGGVIYDIAQVGATKSITLTAQTAAATSGDLTVTVASGATAPSTATVVESTKGVAVIAPDTVGVPKADALADAIAAQKAFNDLVDLFNDARDLNDTLAAKEADVTTVETWLTDNDYNLIKSGLITTDKSDIFTFSNLSDGDSIDSFGAKYGEDGADYLLASDFANYSVVEVAEGSTLAATIFGGDATKLEVFALETSTGVELYFEKEAAAGNLKAGTAGNFDVITLTGVTTEDLNFTDGVFAVALA
ncbi:MAG: hypothetical protein WCR69_09200, partial [Sulfuricurvum sp.]